MSAVYHPALSSFAEREIKLYSHCDSHSVTFCSLVVVQRGDRCVVTSRHSTPEGPAAE